MQRGFKSHAKRLATELRAEIRFGLHGPSDPYLLAGEYGIPVVALSSLEGDARDYFLKQDGSALSGALIPVGTGAVILDNDAQRTTRRRTTMCLERAHVVLGHRFGPSLSDERKCSLGGDQEEEADWLSGEMLIPYEGTLGLAWRATNDVDAAQICDVSLPVARWRMKHSGAHRVAERSRHRRA